MIDFLIALWPILLLIWWWIGFFSMFIETERQNERINKRWNYHPPLIETTKGDMIACVILGVFGPVTMIACLLYDLTDR